MEFVKHEEVNKLLSKGKTIIIIHPEQLDEFLYDIPDLNITEDKVIQLLNDLEKEYDKDIRNKLVNCLPYDRIVIPYIDIFKIKRVMENLEKYSAFLYISVWCDGEKVLENL